MEKIKSELKKSVELWPKVFQRVWIWVFFAAFVEVFISVVFSQLNSRETMFFLTVGLLFLSVSLLISIIGNIVINQAAWDAEHSKRTPLLESLNKNFKYMTIESLRALLPILWRFLLFVIPGLIETVRLYWIVYVVQFDKEYQEGKVDALERSRALVKGRFFSAAGILLLNVVLSMVSMLFGNDSDLLNKPVTLAVSVLISVSLQVWGYILLYRYYQNIKGKHASI